MTEHITPTNTQRLRFRRAELSDTDFMFRLLTEPSWKKFIGDNGIKLPHDAQVYLSEKFIPAYADGLGFWIVEVLATRQAIGICGLVKRSFLQHIDLGFAFLQDHWGVGYALEASQSVIEYASQLLMTEVLWAITVVENAASIKLLRRLGFDYLNDISKPTGEIVSVYELKMLPHPSVFPTATVEPNEAKDFT